MTDDARYQPTEADRRKVFAAIVTQYGKSGDARTAVGQLGEYFDLSPETAVLVLRAGDEAASRRYVAISAPVLIVSVVLWLLVPADVRWLLSFPAAFALYELYRAAVLWSRARQLPVVP